MMQYVRHKATELLNVSITNIPTTNNHLKSFNSHFKDTYIKQFQRGGSQVRVDTLCISLISFITPNLIRRCNLQQKLDKELQNRKSYFGINDQKNYNSAVQINYKQYAYLDENEAKDNAAKRIFTSEGIQKYEFSIDELYVWVKSETKSNSIYTAAILCINWIRQEPANQHLPYISLPTVEELYTQVDDNTEENIQNEINNIEELNIQIQRNQSDESEESDEEYKNLESSQLNDDNLSSTWFFDFQNTNSLALQEQEFHINCHSVFNHLNSLKEISKFFNNFDSKNIIQNNEFEVGKNALNELVQNDSLEKIYSAFQSLNLQKQSNTTRNIKKNPSSSNLVALSPNKKQARHNSHSTL